MLTYKIFRKDTDNLVAVAYSAEGKASELFCSPNSCNHGRTTFRSSGNIPLWHCCHLHFAWIKLEFINTVSNVLLADKHSIYKLQLIILINELHTYLFIAYLTTISH
jgi:hypothetical protein